MLAATLCCVLLTSGLASSAHAGETITFFHNDVAGSPMLATDVNGLQVWKETYRPYGDQLIDATASQSNELWFAGKPYDDSTGLSYMGARYYDPTLGRFMGVDPVGVDPANLHSLNRYTYANNNPYKFRDPDGEFAIPIIVVGSGVLLGAGCAIHEGCRSAFTNLDWQRVVAPLVNDPVVMWSKEKGSPGKSDEAGGEQDRDNSKQLPAGSKPISETPWSGDHGQIKGAVDAGPADNVQVSPSQEIWVENPDGSWTNHGPASSLTGSGKASGQRGKDRDRERDKRRDRSREKRNWSDRGKKY